MDEIERTYEQLEKEYEKTLSALKEKVFAAYLDRVRAEDELRELKYQVDFLLAELQRRRAERPRYRIVKMEAVNEFKKSE